MIPDVLYNHYIYGASTTFSIYNDIRKKVELHLKVVKSIINESKKHNSKFQYNVCKWAIEFLYEDAKKIDDEDLKNQIIMIFSTYKKYINILPKHIQQKAVELGTTNKLTTNFFAKIKRKVLLICWFK